MTKSHTLKKGRLRSVQIVLKVWAREKGFMSEVFVEHYGDSVALERNEAYLVLVKGA